MHARGDVELCRFTGSAWRPLEGGLAEIEHLLNTALERLAALSRVNAARRVSNAAETARIIATMPGPDDSYGSSRWEDDGGNV
jgi:hypothetical protein